MVVDPTTDRVSDVWPHATATDTVWSTAVSGYSAIEKTVAMIATSGTLQDLADSTLWAEGATPEAEIVIERMDNETLATLGLDGLDTTGLIGFARTGLFP